ncbi:hypothetical protein PS918_05769 [Pseudomonas fluorescens]|uniref:RHS repeat-associated core domain-containing protein n=1 Tax=Pseudomonas fluorescens TaxID=294 RepID=A0A5E7UUR9_PSEFL|nr:hypothetical protein PS918_05769 [Pseudomonas fluorescens]
MPTQSRKTLLLAIDQQSSVLNALATNRPHPIAYTPYGHRPIENGLLSLLGFNGELCDPLTGHYHLGKGYRQFNPVLMRFNSPDSWSPFGEGGLNAYGYCESDPVNKFDSSGHTPKLLKNLLRAFGLMGDSYKTPALTTKTGNLLQKNTRNNIDLALPENGKPANTLKTQYLLDANQQNSYYDVVYTPHRKKENHFKILTREQLREQRKNYAKKVIKHHRKNPTPSPTGHTRKVTFAESQEVHEFDYAEHEPLGGWEKVSDIRSNRR